MYRTVHICKTVKRTWPYGTDVFDRWDPSYCAVKFKMAANVSQILLATEAELYVQELKPYSIKELGDAK